METLPGRRGNEPAQASPGAVVCGTKQGARRPGLGYPQLADRAEPEQGQSGLGELPPCQEVRQTLQAWRVPFLPSYQVTLTS